MLPTLLEITGIEYPADMPPLECTSMLAALRCASGAGERGQFHEHIGNAAVRRGDWKLVREHAGEWELYDVAEDPAELHDLAAENPALVAELTHAWQGWSTRCGVLPVS